MSVRYFFLMDTDGIETYSFISEKFSLKKYHGEEKFLGENLNKYISWVRDNVQILSSEEIDFIIAFKKGLEQQKDSLKEKLEEVYQSRPKESVSFWNLGEVISFFKKRGSVTDKDVILQQYNFDAIPKLSDNFYDFKESTVLEKSHPAKADVKSKISSKAKIKTDSTRKDTPAGHEPSQNDSVLVQYLYSENSKIGKRRN